MKLTVSIAAAILLLGALALRLEVTRLPAAQAWRSGQISGVRP